MDRVRQGRLDGCWSAAIGESGLSGYGVSCLKSRHDLRYISLIKLPIKKKAAHGVNIATVPKTARLRHSRQILSPLTMLVVAA